MMRALVVDDEAPARERLRQLLAAVPDVEVIGEAANGEQAVERIGELEPDVVLLDIQMPGASGLEVAACLPRPRPKIIFCTAFDQYAVDAFELHAVDYLLKPVSRIRLARAMERVREKPELEAEADVDRVTEAVHGKCTRLLARCGGRIRIIPQKEVVYFSSEGGLTFLHTCDRKYVLDPTLNDLEDRLDPNLFFRISRGAMVSLDAVAEVLPLVGGIANVALHTGAVLEVSRRRVKELLERLQGSHSAQP
ncbi:MAG TPA: response regulator [Bryobacteraceae bacterium]|nr:response regulator [Bryobacteraceae bacterium]